MKKLIVLVAAVVLMFTMCAPAFAAPAPVPGNPDWDTKYISVAEKNIRAPYSGPKDVYWEGSSTPLPVNPRDNASGDKIPSNAHSADYPGIYFYWNDKQKDSGVLLVDPKVFDLFVDGSFILTAKDSNNYWGYLISPDTGVLKDGIYVYGIPKQLQYLNAKGKKEKDDLKNINMVFIDGIYKSAFFDIEKTWYDEDGKEIDDKALIADLNAKLKFNNGYKLGENEVEITDYKSAWFGKTITVTEQAPAGYTPKPGTKGSISLTVKWNDDPRKVADFHNQKQWAEIKIVKDWDLLGKDKPVALFTITNAAGDTLYKDVPAGVYKVKESQAPFTITEKPLPGFTADEAERTLAKVEAGKTVTVTFKNVEDRATVTVVKKWFLDDEEVFDETVTFTNGWKLGTIEVKAGFTVAFEEEDLFGWNLQSIFINGEEVDAVDFEAEKDGEYEIVFTNTKTTYVPPTKPFNPDIDKLINGDTIEIFLQDSDLTIDDLIDMMSFELFKVDAKGDTDNWVKVADGTLDADGKIVFDNKPAVKGWYVIQETLTTEGAEVFDAPELLYVFISELGVYEEEPVAWVSGKDFGIPVVHDGTGVNYILPNVWDGVLAGQPAYEALKLMGAQWVWDVENTYTYGTSGNVYEESFEFNANEAGTVTGYLAADNAAVVYVNGERAGYTIVAFNTPGNPPAQYYDDFDFGAMDADVFSGGWADGWNYSYSFDINYKAGKNEIIIIAANSAYVEGHPANGSYNEQSNPCGVIFGFITPPNAVFNNTVKTPTFSIEIDKLVEGGPIMVWAEAEGFENLADLNDMMEFILWKLVDGEWVSAAEGILTLDGTITFEPDKFEAGSYCLVEGIRGYGLGIFKAVAPLYFEVDGDYTGEINNQLLPPPPAIGLMKKIPSKRHVDEWWNQWGILAYGASSNSDKYDYYFGFSENFWKENLSVTIGFGTSGSMALATITRDANGKLISDKFEFREQGSDPIPFDQWATGGIKQYPFPISVGAYFDNPYGSGAMQLWLVEIQPRAMPLDSTVELLEELPLEVVVESFTAPVAFDLDVVIDADEVVDIVEVVDEVVVVIDEEEAVIEEEVEILPEE